MLEPIFDAFKALAPRIQALLSQSDGTYSATHNATGDTQLQADVQADLLIEEALAMIPAIKGICSEEKEEALALNPAGRYLIAYDPLDGSSLMGANLSVGTIFGVYEGEFKAENLIASAYILYGPRLELVIAHERVELYRFSEGRFSLVAPLKLEAKGKLNAPGGTQRHWHPKHKALIDSLFEEGYRLRYSGGMVPDLHHILVKGGGLFSYPATADSPRGKLRLLFEVLPFAFIFEKAGGAAIDGKNRLLELVPASLHDTAPCFFGSAYEIDRVRSTYQEL